MVLKSLLLTTMLVGVQSQPQGGDEYLPPNGAASALRPQSNTGHPDDWAGDPINYEFSYEVAWENEGLDFGHQEMRDEEAATGSYHVLLPDGRTLYVDYIADAAGFRPTIRYEGTASYPPPPPPREPQQVSLGSPASEGYKYR